MPGSCLLYTSPSPRDRIQEREKVQQKTQRQHLQVYLQACITLQALIHGRIELRAQRRFFFMLFFRPRTCRWSAPFSAHVLAFFIAPFKLADKNCVICGSFLQLGALLS